MDTILLPPEMAEHKAMGINYSKRDLEQISEKIPYWMKRAVWGNCGISSKEVIKESLDSHLSGIISVYQILPV